MSNSVIMPILGLTMESGVILGWKIEEGSAVAIGDVLLEIESDKSVAEIESEFEGLLLKRYYGNGEEVPCGEVIAVIGTRGEEPPEEKAASPHSSPEMKTPRSVIGASDLKTQETPELAIEKSGRKPDLVSMSTVTTATHVLPRSQKRIIASPRARRCAREYGIELSSIPRGSGSNGRIVEKDVYNYEKNSSAGKSPRISPVAQKTAEQEGLDITLSKGTGPAGRIVKADILALLKTKRKDAIRMPESMEPISIPHTGTRKIIAQRLSESKSTVPHFYLKNSVDMGEIMRTRSSYESMYGGRKVSLTAILVKMISRALERHPGVNASWSEDSILLYPNIDIAVAVAAETGLITPVIRNCQDKGILEIDKEMKDLTERARKGTLTPDEYSGHTFTFTNLGMYGIEDFSAIINLPDAAILAAGAAIDTPVGLSGKVVLRPMMNMTLSGDHRVMDGAVGAEFLRELKSLIELPILGYFK